MLGYWACCRPTTKAVGLVDGQLAYIGRRPMTAWACFIITIIKYFNKILFYFVNFCLSDNHISRKCWPIGQCYVAYVAQLATMANAWLYGQLYCHTQLTWAHRAFVQALWPWDRNRPINTGPVCTGPWPYGPRGIRWSYTCTSGPLLQAGPLLRGLRYAALNLSYGLIGLP